MRTILVVDPRPSMTCRPFPPEVLAGSVEARHGLNPDKLRGWHRR